MSDVSPYGVTQHATDERVTANQIVGESAGLMTANQVSGTSAALFSTAPYKGDKGRHGCVGKNGTCRAAALTGTDLCFFHTQQKETP